MVLGGIVSNKSKCSKCGFKWITGKSGDHSCSDVLFSKINKSIKTIQAAIDSIESTKSNPDKQSICKTLKSALKDLTM